MYLLKAREEGRGKEVTGEGEGEEEETKCQKQNKKQKTNITPQTVDYLNIYIYGIL